MGRRERFKDAFEFLKNRGSVHTQRDVALKMDSSEGNISKAFKGDERVLTNRFLCRFNKAYDNIFNLDWLTDGVGDMFSSIGDITNRDNVYIVPLLPVSAQGGSFNDFVVSVRESDCEKIISPIKGADYAMPVFGDSMAPEYPSGSKILIKRINEKAFIDWGRVYVLDTCNGVVIKKVYPTEDKDVVECRSINPDYPPFKVSFADVYGMYRVLMCMSLK